MKELRIDLEEVVARFGELEDPRSETNKLHPLASVLATAVIWRFSLAPTARRPLRDGRA